MKPIYLDYNATTPIDPEVLQAMLPYLTDHFGNPANTLNSYGWSAENAVKKASSQVASLLHCKSQELIWNAGATEGNNSVVFGLIRKLKVENPEEKIHFLTSNAEHLSVINSFKAAHKYEGIEIDFLPVNQLGQIEISELKKWVKPHTKLISAMWVNNEVGSINPIQDLAEFCQQNKIYFHTDATQAVGKIEVNLEKTPIHFLTFSAHKIYGPKGVGCLYMRSLNPHIQIDPYIFGGGQQNNQRSGTLNVPAIAGAGRAAELAQNNLIAESTRTRELLKIFYTELKAQLPEVRLNGPEITHRSPINLSLLFPSPIDLYLPHLTQLAFSQGAACSTAGVSSSHVLKAIGLSVEQSQATMRVSIGRWTTADELTQAANMIATAFKSK